MKVFSRKNIITLLVIFLCILIPLYSFSLFSTIKLSKLLNTNIIEQVEYRLNRFCMELENLNENLKNSSYVFYFNNDEIQAEYMLESEINVSHGIDLLSDTLNYEQEIEDVFITYNNGKVYAAGGVSSEHVFFSDVKGLSESQSIKSIEIVNNQEDDILFLQGNTNDFLLFNFSLYEDVTINYCINEYVLFDLLQPLVDITPSYIQVVMNDNTSVCFYNDGENDLEVISDIPEIDDSYITISTEIETLGITVNVFNTENGFYQEIIETQNEFFLITAISFLSSLLIAYIVYLIVRKSVFDLVVHIENRNTVNSGFWGFLETKVADVIKDGNDWKKSANNMEFLFKQQIVFQMFNGMYRDFDSVNKALEIYGHEIYEEYFCIIGIITDNPDAFVNTIKEKEHSALFTQYFVLGKEIVLVFQELPNYDHSHKMRENVIEEYKNLANDAGIKELGFSVSFVHSDINDINSAFLETVFTIEKIIDNYDGKVMFLGVADTQKNSSLMLLNDEFVKYREAIEAKNEKTLIDMIKNINKFISKDVVARENKSYLRYRLAQPLINAMKKEGAEDEQFEKVVKTINKRGPDFEKEILYVVQVYCKSNRRDFEVIIQYIKDNYNRYDLSLEEVAVYAGFTKTYLSKLFKTRVGMGYIEYLSKIRMEKARELLETTDISMKDLVEKVGYVDVSAFRRKFKSIYNCSPSEIRRKN